MSELKAFRAAEALFHDVKLAISGCGLRLQRLMYSEGTIILHGS